MQLFLTGTCWGSFEAMQAYASPARPSQKSMSTAKYGTTTRTSQDLAICNCHAGKRQAELSCSMQNHAPRPQTHGRSSIRPQGSSASPAGCMLEHSRTSECGGRDHGRTNAEACADNSHGHSSAGQHVNLLQDQTKMSAASAAAQHF